MKDNEHNQGAGCVNDVSATEDNGGGQSEFRRLYGDEFAVSGCADRRPPGTELYSYKRRYVYATSRDAACDYIVYATGFCCVLPKRLKCSVFSIRGRKILAEDFEKARRLFKRCYHLRMSDLANHELGSCELVKRLRKSSGPGRGPLRAAAAALGFV